MVAKRPTSASTGRFNRRRKNMPLVSVPSLRRRKMIYNRGQKLAARSAPVMRKTSLQSTNLGNSIYSELRAITLMVKRIAPPFMGDEYMMHAQNSCPQDG